MVKISRKDRILLYELSKNCRQSLRALATKIKSHKTYVAYRIKRLEDKKIITSYYTLINTFKLGYESYRVYLSLQNCSLEQRQELVLYLKNHSETYFVSETEGVYDVTFAKWTKNTKELYSFFNEFLAKYRQFVSNYVITPYEYQVYDDAFLQAHPARTSWKSSSGNTYEIDKIDATILRNISANAKVSLLSLGQKVKLTTNAIKYRIKQLEKNKVIQAYRAAIDYTKLDYKWYKIDIHLNNYKDKSKIISHLENNTNMFVIDTSLGVADVEAEFQYTTHEDLMTYLNTLTSDFSSIKNIKTLSLAKLHKFEFVPKNLNT